MVSAYSAIDIAHTPVLSRSEERRISDISRCHIAQTDCIVAYPSCQRMAVPHRYMEQRNLCNRVRRRG